MVFFVFYVIAHYRREMDALWFVVAYIFFTDGETPDLYLFLIFSILFYYTFGVLIGRAIRQFESKLLAAVGVIIDLLLDV